MRTEVVSHDGVTVTVRSAFRRTPVIEAQYMEALRAAYPELVAFEDALFQVDVPQAPTDPKDKKAAERYAAAMERYQRALIPIRAAHRVGTALDNEALPFSMWLSRISAAEGWIVAVGPDGRFDNAAVVTLFEARLNEEGPDFDADGKPVSLWGKIQLAIQHVDAPLTNLDERPPDTLTEAERADPLPAAAA